MAKVTIDLNDEETKALEGYRRLRNLTKQGACLRLVRGGLIRLGCVKPNETDREMGIGK